jgi:thioredoxin reductase
MGGPMALNAQPLGRAGLVVVGCGPTGVAGLVEAALAGIPAIGTEAGPAPLASIVGYMEGLVFTSSAEHYEVGELPLDCRTAHRITREEVLHYYARVISHHHLDIRCGTRCIGLEPRGRHVVVRVTTSGGLRWYRADRVLVTSWYEKRPLDPDLLAMDHNVAVHSTIQNPIQLAGQRVVVLGGGLSAYEVAIRLLQSGQAIVLLSRGGPRPMHRDPRFRRLVAATGSAVFHRISALAFGNSRVRFTCDGARRAVSCDALVAAIGQRLREEVLQMLVGAGVLSRRECRLLSKARSYETLHQEFPQEEEGALTRRAVAELPDLREQVFAGRRGVHLAGGALHPGAANGGVIYSMFSAILAVRSLAGRPLPDGAEAPLPAYLLALRLPEEMPPALAFERISALQPLRASAGTAHRALSAAATTPPGWQGPAGSHPPELAREPAERERILSAADGTLPVARLARRLGIRSAAERAIFFRSLRYLWWNGGLTWLPAGGQSRRRSRLQEG